MNELSQSIIRKTLKGYVIESAKNLQYQSDNISILRECFETNEMQLRYRKVLQPIRVAVKKESKNGEVWNIQVLGKRHNLSCFD